MLHGIQNLSMISEKSMLLTYKQSEAVYIPSQNNDLGLDLENTDEPYQKLIEKLQISSTEVPVSKVLEDFHWSLTEVVTHANVKKI